MLRKYEKIRTEATKTCNYFINNIKCPFEELGCEFLHDNSEKNTFESGEDQDKDKEDDDDDESAKEDNVCYFCKHDCDDSKSLEEHTIKEQ